MASQFSNDGKYFAQFSNDGKLQIWETKENKFQQEYTPEFHLTSPCTCFHFINQNCVINKFQNGSPKKKIRRHSMDNSIPLIILGTSNGTLLVYSIAKGEVMYDINSNTSQPISCLSWCEGSTVYSAIDQFLVSWNLDRKSVQSKWKTGNENITSLLILPNSVRLITASRNIKLWNIKSKEVLKVFTGHSSQVTLLHYVKPPDGSDAYFISGAKGDRLLSCWNINEEKSNTNAVANLIMDDFATSVTHKIVDDGSMNLAAVTKSGVVHVYRHTLNGKCGKPVKPRTTIQIASDTSENKTIVAPIPILNASFNENLGLIICHGFLSLLVFESLDTTNFTKIQCLIRRDLRKNDAIKENNVSNIKKPVVDKHVQYLTPHSTVKSTVKRRNEAVNDVPMELRLENLNLSKADTGAIPKSDNLAQLLVQGLHSKDKEILKTVLHVKDEQIIKNTVSRLPISVIVPLLNELNQYIQGKTTSCNLGITWLKYIINIHTAILLANPELSDLVGPTLSTIESRLTLFNPLNSLKGRLELLVTQLNVDTKKDIDDEPFCIFNDKDSSDSEMEGIERPAHSESENEWEEDSSSDENVNETNNINSDEEDEEMSS